jgi:hypothetical protein
MHAAKIFLQDNETQGSQLTQSRYTIVLDLVEY